MSDMWCRHIHVLRTSTCSLKAHYSVQGGSKVGALSKRQEKHRGQFTKILKGEQRHYSEIQYGQLSALTVGAN